MKKFAGRPIVQEKDKPPVICWACGARRAPAGGKGVRVMAGLPLVR